MRLPHGRRPYKTSMQSTASPPDSRSPIISFIGVMKAFGPQKMVAVRDINLDVNSGEFITLVGPSGCGKSTLLNMAAGLFQPTEGQVTYQGRPVTRINRNVGYMTQADHLLPWRRVA